MARKRPNRRPKLTPEGISHTARGAVIVKFPEQPSDNIREQLRGRGFRWNRGRVAWINKSTPENEELAARVWAQFQQEGGVE